MTLFLRFAAGLAALTVVLATPYTALSYSSGAPAGFSGNVLNTFNNAPETCGSGGCHDSFDPNTGTGSVTIDAPASVAAGETVTVTVTVDNTTTPASGTTSIQGFQATVRDVAVPTAGGGGNSVGELTVTDPVNTRNPIGGNTEYVTHTTAGHTLTSWSFDWTAPAEGGPATMFVAGNAANNDDDSSGDYIYTTTQQIAVLVADEESPDERAFALAAPFPNPARESSKTTISLAAPATVSARIVDGRGRTVRDIATAERRAGAHDLALDVRGLAAGTYFVVVTADGARRTQPLIVAR